MASLSPPAFLGAMSSPEVADNLASILLIPLGSTEQHGPHLPLQTDTVIAEAWCERLAAGDSDVMIAPALPYGSAGEHQDFCGTLSIGQDALCHLLIELTRSASHHFARIVFVSGHAGNASPMAAAIKQLRGEGHDVAGLLPILVGSDAHAGHSETSIMLALDRESVRIDLLEVGNTEPLDELLQRLRLDGLLAISANGVLGDPRAATAQEGQRLIEVLEAVSIRDGGHC